MPVFNTKPFPYRGAKESSVNWSEWKGGLNTLLAPTEINSNELVQADNLYLVGKGVPKKRGGTANYFLTGASVATGSQRVRGLRGVMFASGVSGVNELLAIGDEGFLVKKSGASYAIMPGYSYSSGYYAEMVQAFNNVYIANGTDPLTKYNGVTIYPFIPISSPTNVTATNFSGPSGTYTYNYVITGVNAVGETVASNRASIANLPQSLTSNIVRLEWSPSSPTSNVVSYTIYGRKPGREVRLTSIDAGSLTTVYRYDDNGSAQEAVVVKALPPTTDTTNGPKYKYHVFNKDKLVGANLMENPCRVIWSGGGTDNIEKFHFTYGGGYIDINANSGEVITGLADAFDYILVFMSRSTWRLKLTYDSGIGLVVPSVSLINHSVGCVSHRTIRAVENDYYFLGRGAGGIGMYVVGYEPQIAGDVLRTNKLSAKVNDFFETIPESQLEEVAATYQDKKYRITRPDGRELIFDRERLAFMGPNIYNAASPGVYEIYYSTDGVEHLLFGDRNDTFVTEFSDDNTTDKGVDIATRLITKKEQFGDPFVMKSVLDVFTNWRNVSGSPSVDVIVEGMDGSVNTIKSFTVDAETSSAGVGWGFDRWGTARWGTSAGAGSSAQTNDLVRWAPLDAPGRFVQLDVRTPAGADTYELLAVKFNVRPLPTGTIRSSWQV
jgi:hypothetical protein